MFLATGYFDLNPGLLHLPVDRLVNLLNFNIGLFAYIGEALGDGRISIGFELLKCEQLHFMHIFIHANALGQRRVNVHCLFGNPSSLFRAANEMQRAHIVQPVG